MKAAPQVNPYTRQSRPRAKRFAMRPVAYCVALACCELAAAANPSGPQVMQGNVQMQGLGTNNLRITNSPGSIINWQGFSIGAGSTTQFIQQSASSAVLNRVVGADISQIHGQLLSNGRVFLINPAGILIGAGAVIDTAGFVGSTLNMQNADFLAGKLRFEGSGGAIQNAGTLRSSGDIFLVGSTIENSGIIRSDAGSVVLAAGKSVTIASPTIEGVVFTMQAPEDRVVNLGSIQARDAAALFAGTLRHSGDIRAGGLGRDSSGRVVLLAQKDAIVDGAATISADSSSGKGGSVHILGERVGVLGTASVTARGPEGGGEILVGGDFRGANPLVPNARLTYFGRTASLDASAAAQGDGGRVIVWADDLTRAYGAIRATGGANAGDGGFVEVSGKRDLDFGARVYVGAPHGRGGTLLLDPTNINIQTTTAGCCELDGFLTPPNDSTILQGDVDAADPAGRLNFAELQATFTAGSTIRLEATNNINITTSFTLQPNINLTLVPNADNVGGGAVNFGAAGQTVTLGTNGTLALAGPAPVLNWSNGNFSGTATSALSIPSNAIVNVTGPTRIFGGQLTINNAGRWNINMANGAQIDLRSSPFNNSGVIEFQGGAGVTNSIVEGGASVLTNSGTIRNVGAGTALLDDVAGAFTLTSLDGATYSSSAGPLNIQPTTASYAGTTNIGGNAVFFPEGAHTFAANSIVNGTINQTALATFTFNGNATTNGLYNFNPDPGPGAITINGGTLTVAGGMTWVDNGTFTGIGAAPTLSIPTGAVFTVNGIQRNLTGLTVNNAGRIAIDMADSNSLVLDNVTVNNNNTIEFLGAANFNSITTNTASTLNNNGTILNSSNGLIQIFRGAGPANTLTFANNNATLSETGTGELRIEDVTGSYAGITTIVGNNVRFTSGTHTHTGTVRVLAGSSYNLAGGTHNFNDGSALDLRNNLNYTPGAATLNFNGTGAGTTLVAGSTISLPGAAFLGGAGKIVNEGTLNIPASAQIDASFDNRGTLDISTGQTGTFAGAVFDQTSGTLRVNGTGTFTKNGVGDFNWIGGSLAGSGTFNAGGGATFSITGAGARTLAGPTLVVNNLALPGGSLTIQSGTFTPSGTTTVANGASLILSGGTNNTAGSDFTLNGTLQADTAITATTFNLNATGTLSGSAAMTGTTLNWVGGTVTGSGSKTFSSVSSLGAGTRTLSGNLTVAAGSTWTNTGTLHQTGTGRVTLLGGAIVNNGGVWTLTGTDTTPIVHGGGAATTFNNTGIFTNNATGVVHTLTPTNFHNTNLVSVVDGTLAINANGTHTGRFDIAPAGVLEFAGGTQQMNAGAEVLGAGLTRLSGGTLSNAVDLTLNGPFTWTGGTVTGAGLFTTAGTSTITGNSVLLSDSRWTNTGTATLTGSIALGGSGVTPTTFTNAGTLTDTSLVTSPILTATIATNKSFVNSGIFNKNAGSANFQGIDAPFTNTADGTVNVNAGTLSVPAFPTNPGTIVLQGGTLTTNGNALGNTGTIRGNGTVNLGTQTLTSSGTLDFTGASTITGSLAVTAGAVSGAGSLAVSGGFTWTGGTVSNMGGVTVTGATGVTAGAPQLTGRLSTGAFNVSGGATPAISLNGVLTTTGTGASTLTGTTTSLTNAGTINVAGGGNLVLDNGAALTSSGTVDLLNASGIEATNGVPTFTNSGTLTKTSGTTSVIGVGGPVNFVNTGMLTPALNTTIQYASNNQFNNGTQFGGAGTHLVSANGALNGIVTVNGSGSLTVGNGAVLTNNGTTTFSGSAGLTVGTGSTFLNSAGTTFTLNTAGNGGINGAGTFRNEGIVNSGAAGTTAIGTAFTNAFGGTLAVSAGTLSLPGLNANAGTITLSNGATLATNGSINNTGTMGGVGTIDVGAGTLTSSNTLTFAGPSVVTGSVAITNGTLGGAGTLAISGGLTLTGGSLTNTGGVTVTGTTTANTGAPQISGKLSTNGLSVTSGTLDVVTGGVLELTGAGAKSVSGTGVLQNAGTVNFNSGTLNVTTAAGSTPLANLAGGTFNIGAGAGNITFSGTQTFTNAGNLSSTGSHDIGGNFANALGGTLSIGAGTLALPGFATNAGTVTLTNGATLTTNGTSVNNTGTLGGTGTIDVGAGTLTSSNTLTFAGPSVVTGSVAITNGTLGGAGTLAVSGGLTLTGGSLTNTGGVTVAGTTTVNTGAPQIGGKLSTSGLSITSGVLDVVNGGTLDLTGTGAKSVSGTGVLRNAGIVNFNSGTLNVTTAAGSTPLVNLANGTFNIGAGAGNIGFSSTQTFTNAGNLTSAGNHEIGSGASTRFHNTGTVVVTSGTLSLLVQDVDPAGPLGDTGSYTAMAGSTLRFRDAFRDFLAASAIGGDGAIQFDSFSGGTFNIGGAYNPAGASRIDGNTTVNFNSAATLPDLQLPGTFTGQVGGSGTLTLNAFTWQGGNIVGSGVFRTAGISTVSGAGVKSVTGRPWDNTGDLTIGGGAVTVNSAFTNPGTVTLGTTLQLNQNFNNTNSMTLNAGSTLRAGTGVTSFSNGGLLKGVGTIDMTAAGVPFTNNGTIRPGASPGTLVVLGDYTQGLAGILDMELGGTTPGTTYDVMQVSGIANLAGTLNANWVAPFTGAAADQFTVMTFASRVGDFTTFNPPTGGTLLTTFPGAASYVLAAAAGGGGGSVAAGSIDTTGEVRRLYDRLLGLVDEPGSMVPIRGGQICE